MCDSITTCDNFIGGKYEAPEEPKYMDVNSPSTGDLIGRVCISSTKDVDHAVARAKAAWPAWKSQTVKTRATIMFKFHQLLGQHTNELVDLIMLENGKNRAEAIGDVAKGMETVEWACSMPQLFAGKTLEVSRGISCSEYRDALGVVACIVPFNFPAMVPMWTMPIALTCGNCVILKPSEKVPLTMNRIAVLAKEAGVPDGVFQMVHGTIDAVNGLIDNEDVAAVTFVGSSRVAELVSKRARNLNKRCIALGGAKNHMVALPDCNTEMAASDIMASFAGCAGQRCMAASVLLLVGDSDEVLQKLVAKASGLTAGQEQGQVGPVIDAVSQARMLKYVNDAEVGGAKILLDGRSWAKKEKGTWFGPTIILHENETDAALQDEIFGPVISCLRVKSWADAIRIENGNEHGNAAAVYTSHGGHADWFTSRFRAGMLGVNIGVPVPREPFSFGGMYGTKSKYGDMDITGDGAMEFFTTRKKITTKWGPPAPGSCVDNANFGSM
jgi:malonate-semialdehyde dehydrogenase (acetylating)/methylmalonate-semialdehyde dehydrogenase